MPQKMPFMQPKPSQLSPAITANATTLINSGSGDIFNGVIVNTAGTFWTIEAYNGNPASGGRLLGTFSGDTVGPVLSPAINCKNGLYVTTSGTTPGSVVVCYNT